MKTRRYTLAGLTLLGLGTVACHTEPEPTVAEPRAPVDVAVTRAWRAEADRSFTGRIESVHQADVATRTSGVLQSMPVDVGDRVREGQLLARLDDRDVTARIQAAEAQVALADQTWGRVSRLAAEGAASQQELEVAEAGRETARAAVVEARSQAGYTQVVSPFDGVVTARLANVGDLAVPGRPLLRIQSVGQVRVVADLPADAQSLVAVGDRIRVEGAGAPIDATVSRIVPVLDARSARFRLEATLDVATAPSAGTVVSIRVPGAGGGAQWIPADAVVRRGQLEGAFTVESDTVRLRWLRLGREVAGAVEVLAGPTSDLFVVRRPGDEVADGAPVGRRVDEGGPDEG